MKLIIIACITFLTSCSTPTSAIDADNIFDVCPTDTTTHQKIFINGYPCKDPKNDVCPTDTTTHQKIFINGYPCKDPKNVTASDFKSSLLNEAGDTDNFYRSSTTFATAAEFPGLNTLGLSAARIDIEVDGAVTPHAHPRASEMMFVRSGVLVVGFVDSNNIVFQKSLKKGDVFVFPKGLLHFCFNNGFEDATVFSVMNSQNPGLVSLSGAMFKKEVFVKKLVSMGKGDLDGVSLFD